jgi:hypothetical protein
MTPNRSIRLAAQDTVVGARLRATRHGGKRAGRHAARPSARDAAPPAFAHARHERPDVRLAPAGLMLPPTIGPVAADRRGD